MVDLVVKLLLYPNHEPGPDSRLLHGDSESPGDNHTNLFFSGMCTMTNRWLH